METIAVYWENKVKTYGFQVVSKLSLFRISIAPQALAGLGAALFYEIRDMQFNWILVQRSSRQVFEVFILLKQQWEHPLQTVLARYRQNSTGLDLRIDSPVEMIFFHGPHFGDRYGIADTALRTLREKDLPIIASGCTGASVYIILPEHLGAKAADTLSKVFDTP